MSNFVDEGHICIRAKSAYSINTVFDPAKQNRQVLMYGDNRDRLTTLDRAPAKRSFRGRCVGGSRLEILARELLGGNGILLDNHVGRFVADADAIYSYEGTREIIYSSSVRSSPVSALSSRRRSAWGLHEEKEL